MPLKLLIVDDDPDVRELLRHILMLRGYDVITAADGREALEAAAAHHVTAALIDLNMPGMSGTELCRALLEQDRTFGRRTPVWIMTGAYRVVTAEAARAAGALMVLRKPLKVAELCKRFERAVQLHLDKSVSPSAAAEATA
jgi:CheY-like chemotaxis protein